MAKTISDQQLALNQSLHQSDPNFGNRSSGPGAVRLPLALLRMHEKGLCSSVLDYGTGKGLLVDRLRRELPDSVQVMGFDPAVERFSQRHEEPFDIVTCLDVLEHVDIDSIDASIQDIKRLTKFFCYVIIDLQPAVKRLPNGRNAHILLAPAEWWVSRFSQNFSCLAAFPVKHESGFNQKIVMACSQNPALMPYIYSFLDKINVYNAVCSNKRQGKKP